MKYTTQELIWIQNLLDKAIIEASGNMEQLKESPIKALVELNHDNMVDLREKVTKHIQQQQRLGRIERQER